MKTLKKTLSASLAAATLTIAVPAAADTYIVAVGAASNSLQGKSAARFAEELQNRLGDAHKVEFYADAQLGNEKELMQRLRLGTVDFTLISSIMTNVAPEFALFDMPFLVQDRAHLKAIDADIVRSGVLTVARSPDHRADMPSARRCSVLTAPPSATSRSPCVTRTCFGHGACRVGVGGPWAGGTGQCPATWSQ